MAKDALVIVAKIVGAHGIKGACRVKSFAESESFFEADQMLLLKTPAGRQQQHTIQWVKPRSGFILLSLKGICDRNQAEALVGAEVFFPKNDLPAPEQDEYYWFDIIGLAVYTVNGRHLGQVESIIATGANDVYVVGDKANPEAKEVLIPALKSVVLEIDLTNHRMQVNLPPGLE